MTRDLFVGAREGVEESAQCVERGREEGFAGEGVCFREDFTFDWGEPGCWPGAEEECEEGEGV